MNLYSMYLTYRNINRIREIIAVLLRHGFSHFVERTDLKRFLPFSNRLSAKKQASARQELNAATRLRLVFEELGPTFIKFGQMLSRRRDLLPDEFVNELSLLEDRVTPLPFATIRPVLDAAYGSRIGELFDRIDETPIASASLAQVHHAWLADGTPVVLKIRRPGLVETIENDIAVLGFLATMFNRYFPEFRQIRVTEVVEEFGNAIRKEADFQHEISNLDLLRRIYAEFLDHEGPGPPPLVVPKAYRDRSTADVILMERVDGVKITDSDHFPRGIDVRAILTRGFECFIRRLFETGVFHGDLHPGNVSISADGSVILYDFGNIGFLSNKVRRLAATMLIDFVGKDYERMVLNLYDAGMIEEDTKLFALERDLREAMEWRAAMTVKDLDIGGFLSDLITIARKHHLVIPVELAGFLRTIMLMDGIGRDCVPDFSMGALLERCLDAELKAGAGRKEVVGELLGAVHDFKRMALRLPDQVDRLMRKMLADRFTIDFVHTNLEPMIDELKKSSNRIAVSLIVAALILGSSIVFFSDKGPHLFGYPVLGLLGFLTSLLFGFVLLIGIIRSGRL